MTATGSLPRLAYVFAVAVLLAAACLGTLVAPLNTDTAWMLVAARRVLHGERLYVDLMETNPPLIVWLWIGPAVISLAGRLSDLRLAGLVVAALIAACSLLALAMLGRETSSRALRLWLMSAWLAAAVGLCLWDVGQREQLAAMLTLPYACLAARTIAGARAFPAPRPGGAWVVLVGVLAGIGFALKPFFLGALVAIELIVLAAAGWRRTIARRELWAVLAVHGVYWILILAVTPEYLRDMAPAVLATYGAYGNGVEWVLQSKSAWLPAILAVVALACSWVGPLTMAGAVSRVTSAATLGWLAGFVIQGKGWRYHLIPVMVFGAVALAAVAAHLWYTGRITWRRSARGRILTSAAFVALVLAAVPTARGARRVALTEWRDWRVGVSATDQLTAVVSQLAPGDPIYVLSTNMAPAFPVVNLAGAQWPYRYHFLWPLPGLYPGPTGTPIPYRSPADQGPLERTFFDRVVMDLERTPPRLLIVDRQRDQQGMAHGRPFDFLRYFSASPRFVAVLSHYRRAGTVGPFEIYERVR